MTSANGIGGLSLWLAPEETCRARLAMVIRDLARRAGTPVFPPHLTLLGRVIARTDDARGRLETLAARLPCLDLSFHGLGQRDAFYRALFLEVADTTALREARTAALEAFGSSGADWAPHLSLIYGDLSADRKQALAAGLAGRLPARCGMTALELWRTDGGPPSWRQEARVELA